MKSAQLGLERREAKVPLLICEIMSLERAGSPAKAQAAASLFNGTGNGNNASPLFGTLQRGFTVSDQPACLADNINISLTGSTWIVYLSFLVVLFHQYLMLLCDM